MKNMVKKIVLLSFFFIFVSNCTFNRLLYAADTPLALGDKDRQNIYFVPLADILKASPPVRINQPLLVQVKKVLNDINYIGVYGPKGNLMGVYIMVKKDISELPGALTKVLNIETPKQNIKTNTKQHPGDTSLLNHKKQRYTARMSAIYRVLPGVVEAARSYVREIKTLSNAQALNHTKGRNGHIDYDIQYRNSLETENKLFIIS